MLDLSALFLLVELVSIPYRLPLHPVRFLHKCHLRFMDEDYKSKIMSRFLDKGLDEKLLAELRNVQDLYKEKLENDIKRKNGSK